MLDADPTVAERHLASSCLENAINKKHTYARSIKARLALVHLYPLEDVEWIAHDGSLEEDMEALRIALGSAFYKRNNELLAKIMDFPLFHHLPMPDRLLWRGLHQLSLKNYAQGRKYLMEACDKFDYQRAALILTVHYLECNMLQEAKLFMKKVGNGTNNSKIVLLRAYIEEQEGNGETAHATYKKLLQRGETRAQYALGNYYLRKAYYKDAIQAFRSVLNEKTYTHPDDLTVITLCTTFMVEPRRVNLWNELEHLDASQKQMWLWWNASLAQLWYGNVPDIIAIFDLLFPMLEYSGPKKDAIVLEIVKVLLLICSKNESIEHGEKFLTTFERISRLSDSSLVKQICQMGTTTTAQKMCSDTRETYRLFTRNHIDNLLEADSTNGSLALFLAFIYLTYNKPEHAIVILKNVHPLDEQEQKLCRIFADILEGQMSIFENVASSRSNATTRVKLGYDLLNAVSAFMTNHVTEGSKALFEAFCKDTETTALIVDMKCALPYLCVGALQERNVSPKLTSFIHDLADDVQERDEIASLARCLAVLGEPEHSYHVWERFKREDITSQRSWRQEIAQLLSYIAVRNYNAGNIFEAIRILHKVAYWVSDTEQAKVCNRLANHLKLQYAACNLLTMMFPAMDEASKGSGRYAYLVGVIGRHTLLKEVLAKNEGGGVRQEWGKVVTQSLKDDARLLHFRAISYRDYILSQRTKAHEAGDWIKCTVLWVLMLCSEEFWIYFSSKRSIAESGERESLDEIEQDTLFYNAIEHIFAIHKLYGSQAFAANNYQEAKTHFYCLDLCQKGEQALLLELEEQKLRETFSLYSKQINWVKACAGKVFKEWTDALIREAKKATEDVDTLRSLKVSRNYKAGICILEAFIELDVPVSRVLATCLYWYNEWANELVKVKEYSQPYIIINSASKIAEKLITLCVKGEGYKKEKQVLSGYFMRRGSMYHHADEDQSTIWYLEALEWNPGNSTAKSWLKDLEEKDLSEDDDELEDDNE